MDDRFPTAIVQLMCCPVSRSSLRRLTDRELEILNSLILSGAVKRYDTSQVDLPFEDGLITVDGERIYPILDGIPTMQIFESIQASKVPALHLDESLNSGASSATSASHGS